MAADLPTKRLRIDPDMYTFPESSQRAAPGCEMGFWRRGKGRAPAQYGEIAAPRLDSTFKGAGPAMLEVSDWASRCLRECGNGSNGSQGGRKRKRCQANRRRPARCPRKVVWRFYSSRRRARARQHHFSLYFPLAWFHPRAGRQVALLIVLPRASWLSSRVALDTREPGKRKCQFCLVH